MTKKKLTAPSIHRIRPGARVKELSDGGTALRLVVQTSGHMSFAMRFRRPDGKHGKLTLGPFNSTGQAAPGQPVIGGPLTLHEARLLAAEILRKRAMGDDVIADAMADKLRRKVEPAVRDANSFATVAREFCKGHRVRGRQPRDWRRSARYLGLDYPTDGSPPTTIPGSLCARWKDKQVGDIDGAALHAVVNESIRHGVPGIASAKEGASEARGRRLAGVLGALFKWAVKHRHVSTNPMRDVWRPADAQSRDRVLSDAEVASLWRAAAKVGVHGKVWRMLLLTGLRREEVARLEWSELSDDLAVITLPGSRTKNGKAHTVWLPRTATEILKGVERRGRFVFSATGTGHYPLGNFGPIKRKLDEEMGPAAPWQTHDIRRTVVTGLGELGIRPDVIELTVNHISGSRSGVAGVYNRSELMTERKAALQRWADHVAGLVTGRSAAVVPIRRRP
jgi:integrase